MPLPSHTANKMRRSAIAFAFAFAFAVSPGGAWIFGTRGQTGHEARVRVPRGPSAVAFGAVGAVGALGAVGGDMVLASEPRTWERKMEDQCFADAFERLKNASASAGPGAFVSCAYSDAGDELLFDLMNCDLRRRNLGNLQCWSHDECNSVDFDSPVTTRQSHLTGAYTLARISQVDLCTYIELQRQNALAASAQAAAHASAKATDAAIRVLSNEQARSCNRTAEDLGSCNRELVRRADLNGVTMSDLQAARTEIKGLRERLDATWYKAAGDIWHEVSTHAKGLREQLGNAPFTASAVEAVTNVGNAVFNIPNRVARFARDLKNTALGIGLSFMLCVTWYLRPRAPRR